jgi:hypothetical protein
MPLFHRFFRTKVSIQVRGTCSCSVKEASSYGEELSRTLPNRKLEDYPLSSVRTCLFNTFAATIHIGDRSSFRKLGARHAVVTGTHLSRYISNKHKDLFDLKKNN